MVASQDLYGVAGILEGEGCFTRTLFRKNGIHYCYPVVKVGMCDKDVIEHIATILESPVHRQDRGQFKEVWMTAVNGFRSLPIMLQVFPLMGERRRRRIESLLSAWEHDHTHQRKGNQWTRKPA